MLISVFGGTDRIGPAGHVERARAAADDGFHAVWFPQTPGTDALTALAAAAVSVPGIGLGTAVVPVQGRHPIPLAQAALTVADLAGPGRFTLGVGVTHPGASEGWFGIPYAGVVDLCAEELEALDGLLSPGRTADVEGDRLTARLTLWLEGPRPDLVVAALGPRMLDLAGRWADGTVTWMTGTATLAGRVVPRLRAAAEAAGRGGPRVVVGLPVCVTDEVGEARARVAATMANASQLPSYRRMLAAEGVAEPVDIALVGGEGEVADRIAALGAAGATELLANVQGDPDEVARTRAFLGALARSGA